jgi:hypothetical protein
MEGSALSARSGHSAAKHMCCARVDVRGGDHCTSYFLVFLLCLLVDAYSYLLLTTIHKSALNMLKDDTLKETEDLELNGVSNESSPRRYSSTPTADDPVVKIGHTPTVPHTLDKLVGLIGVNSSVVCPWPNFYFVAALNLGNGGSLGLLIGTLIACIGMAPVYLSLAEKMRK